MINTIKLIEELILYPHEKGKGKTTIQNTISYLRKNGIIERIGSAKTGYWKVVE